MTLTIWITYTEKSPLCRYFHILGVRYSNLFSNFSGETKNLPPPASQARKDERDHRRKGQTADTNSSRPSTSRSARTKSSIPCIRALCCPCQQLGNASLSHRLLATNCQSSVPSEPCWLASHSTLSLKWRRYDLNNSCNYLQGLVHFSVKL